MRRPLPLNSENNVSKNLFKTFFYQLKGTHKSLDSKGYYCEASVIEYCVRSNLPTVLFVVDNLDKPTASNAYWYHFSNLEKIVLGINEADPTTIRARRLPLHRLNTDKDVDNFYQYLLRIAAAPSPALEVTGIIRESLDNYYHLSITIASIVFITKVIDFDYLITILVKMTRMGKNQIKVVINSLIKDKLLYKSKNEVRIEDPLRKTSFGRYEHIEILFEAVSQNDFNLESLFEILDPKYHTNMVQMLRLVNTPKVTIYMESRIEGILKKLNTLIL